MRTGKLIALMGLFVALGFPLVWYLWEVLNQVLSGVFDGARLLIAVPVALALAALLVQVSRSVQRWDRSGGP